MSNQKKIKKYGIPASLLAGGLALGSMLAPIGLASAQEGDDTTDDTRSAEEGAHRHRPGGAMIAELLGLDRDELKAAFDDGQTLAEIAADQGITETELVDALVAQATERIDQAVENGRIGADDAAERIEHLEERMTERVNTEPGDLRDGHHRHHRPGRFVARQVLDELGLDRETVRAGYDAGKTLAETVFDAVGVSEEELVDALVTGATERIDQAVENGRIDVDDAADLKAGLVDEITERVNAAPGDRRGHTDGPAVPGPSGQTEESSTV